jgi:hypothetical protein
MFILAHLKVFYGEETVQRENRVVDGFFSQIKMDFEKSKSYLTWKIFCQKINLFLGFSYSFPAFAKRWL